MLVLREQLGLEPVGGVYVPVGGRSSARRAALGPGGVAGFSARDYLEPDEFDEAISTARRTAVGLVERIRAGDVRHDPQGAIAHWCDLWRMCRKERP